MRPKTFDPDQTLNLAMIQFWESGYEGSSMQDLVDRMGISRQSLYDTYGNKRELFEETLKRYIEDVIGPRRVELLRPDVRPSEAVREYLENIAHGAPDMPIGCLMVRTATEVSLEDAEIGKLLNKCFSEVFEALAEVVQRGQDCGEFDPDRSAGELAGSIIASGIGLHVMRRLPDRGANLRPSVDAIVQGLRGPAG